MATTTEAFSSCRYGVEDESPHAGWETQENYNESVYFNFLDPHTKLGGIVRVGNRPTLGYQEFSVNLKLPGGGIAFRAAREDSTTNDEFECGGLKLAVDEPTRSWNLTFDGTLSNVAIPSRMAAGAGLVLKSSPVVDCEIELTYNAGSPLFVLDAGGSGNATPGEASRMGTDHYEQFGTVSGRVRLGSQTWELNDVASMRDHTWGPRVWGTFTGEWTCAFLSDGTAMTLLTELQATGKRVSSGVVMFDGKPHHVTDYEVFTAYDGGATTDGRHRSIVHAEGLPAIPLDGVISHFAPVSMATGEHRTRLASMTVEYVGGAGGCAIAEFLRPIPSR
jgi:hypothetical protein